MEAYLLSETSNTIFLEDVDVNAYRDAINTGFLIIDLKGSLFTQIKFIHKQKATYKSENKKRKMHVEETCFQIRM